MHRPVLVATALLSGCSACACIPRLRADQEGADYYVPAAVEDLHTPHTFEYEDFQQGFGVFVMIPDVDASGRKELGDPDNWDEPLYARTVDAMRQMIHSKTVFRRMEALRDDYASVVHALRDAGLPDVFAAVPYAESRYERFHHSARGEIGPWAFAAADAHRFGLVNPTDLAQSTAAGVAYLREPMDDDELKASGGVVQLAIASVNARNVKASFHDWAATHLSEDWPGFYGAAITCPDEPDADGKRIDGYCGDSPLHSSTQRYVAPVVAFHLLAVCYYGQNHADMPDFAAWAKYAGNDGYCNAFVVPKPDEL
jgi:hypothetical protein